MYNVVVGKRIDKAVGAMDGTSWDEDGRQRLSSYSRADLAYWSTLLDGWLGWVALALCGSAIVALLVWVFH